MSNIAFRGCKAVLFDFGGTLDSDGGHWLDRFYDLYDRSGLELPKEDIKRAFYNADDVCCADKRVNSLGLRPLMEFHVHLQFKTLGISDSVTERHFVEAFCGESERIFRRNSPILDRIKSSYRLGVVSNFYGNVEVLCKEAGFLKSLDVVLDSVQVGISKPDPRIFMAALDRLDLAPEKVVFVGDSYERDITPTNRMGMKTIWLKGPNPRMPVDACPVDASVSSLPEVEKLVS